MGNISCPKVTPKTVSETSCCVVCEMNNETISMNNVMSPKSVGRLVTSSLKIFVSFGAAAPFLPLQFSITQSRVIGIADHTSKERDLFIHFHPLDINLSVVMV